MTRCALVLGSGGQDGRILSAQLLAQGMRVVGVDLAAAPRAEGVEPFSIDLSDRALVHALVQREQPAEVYYLAAFHHASEQREQVDVGHLFRQSFAINVDGLLSTLEALRAHAPQARLFYAASSHVFGAPTASPQNEETELRPQSPYAVSKCAGMGVCRVMREQHHMFAVSGVLYNHESSLRSRDFVSAKIAHAAADVARALHDGLEPPILELASLDSMVDWSAAEDITRAMQAMLRAPAPRDYVVGSGVLHSVRDFCRIAFDELGLPWERYVRVRPVRDGVVAPPNASSRPLLVADASRLGYDTGWVPQVSFDNLCRRLVRENMS